MRGASSFKLRGGEVGGGVSGNRDETRQRGSPGEMRQVVGGAVGMAAAPCECSSEDFLTWMEELTRSQRQTWDLASSRDLCGPAEPQHERCVLKCTHSRDAWLLADSTGGESDARTGPVVLHNCICQLQTACSPCSSSSLEAACRRVTVSGRRQDARRSSETTTAPLIDQRTRLLNALACATPPLCDSVPPPKY
jgi:hypothetical protein